MTLLYFDHPWLLQVSQVRPILGPNALAGLDFALTGLDDLGLSDQQRFGIILAVDHYVTGTARTYVQQRQVVTESGISDEVFWATQAPILEAAMASGMYPRMAGLSGEAFTIEGTEAFEFGLTALLDGVQRFLDDLDEADPGGAPPGLGRGELRTRRAPEPETPS